MVDEVGVDSRPASPWRRAWDWLWEPSLRQLPIGACPRCGATVVVTSAGRRTRRTIGDPPPDEGQLLAACAEHGWAPHNARTVRLRGPRGEGAG